jgi:hypothetical protein
MTHIDPEASQAEQQAGCSIDHDDELLRYYGKLWSYQSKLVLVDKEPHPGLNCALSSHGPYLLHTTPFTLPGVAALEPYFLVMWRPWCIGVKLSSHGREYFEKDISTGLLVLFRQFKQIAESHQRLVRIPGARVLLISYAQLIWDTERLTHRLLDFLPCLQSLKSDFTPRLGVDIFAENAIKVHGSIVQFGNANVPSTSPLPYSMQKSRCETELPVPPKDGHKRCEQWCEEHKSSWLLKCTWTERTCNACSQCVFTGKGPEHGFDPSFKLPLDAQVRRYKEEETYLRRHTTVL